MKELAALDDYFALMGVSRWQSLAKKATIAPVETPPPRTVRARRK